jgi:hypothetical protein
MPGPALNARDDGRPAAVAARSRPLTVLDLTALDLNIHVCGYPGSTARDGLAAGNLSTEWESARTRPHRQILRWLPAAATG